MEMKKVEHQEVWVLFPRSKGFGMAVRLREICPSQVLLLLPPSRPQVRILRLRLTSHKRTQNLPLRMVRPRRRENRLCFRCFDPRVVISLNHQKRTFHRRPLPLQFPVCQTMELRRRLHPWGAGSHPQPHLVPDTHIIRSRWIGMR